MSTERGMVVNADTRRYSPLRSKFPFILNEVRRIRKLHATHVNHFILTPVEAAYYSMVFRFIRNLIPNTTSLHIR